MFCRSTFQCRHCRVLRNTSIIPFVARSPSVCQVEICKMEWGSSIQTPENGPCLVQNLVYFDNCSQWNRFICQIFFMVHQIDVLMGAMASQITSLTSVYSDVYSCANQRKHQSSTSLAFVRRIHRWPVNSSHKRPVTRKIFPFDTVIMNY